MFKNIIFLILLIPSLSFSQNYIIPRDTSNYWNYDGSYQAYVPNDTIYYFKSALFTPINNTDIRIRKYKTRAEYSEESISLVEEGGRVIYDGYTIYDSSLTIGFDTTIGGTRTIVTIYNSLILGKTYKVQSYYRHIINGEYYSILEIKIAKGLGIIYLKDIQGVGAGTASGPEYNLKSFFINDTLYGNFNPEFITEMNEVFVNSNKLVRFLFRTKQGPYKLDFLINDLVYSTDTISVNTNQQNIIIPNIVSTNCKLKLTSIDDTSLYCFSTTFAIKDYPIVPIIPRDSSNYWNYDGVYQPYVPGDSIYYFKSALFTPKNDSTFVIRKYKTNTDYSEEEVTFVQEARKLKYKGITIYDDNLTSGYDTISEYEREIVTLTDTAIFGKVYKVQNFYRFIRVNDYYSVLDIKIAKGLGITYWKELSGFGAGTYKGPIYTLRSVILNNLFYGDFNPEFITQMQGTYIAGTNIKVRFLFRTKTGPYKMDLMVNNKVHSTKVISNVNTNSIDWIIPEVNSDSCQFRIIYYSNSTLRTLSNLFSIHTPVNINENNIVFDYNLFQNYPNPFNPSSKIKYSIKEESLVKLIIYNSLGEVVKYFVESLKAPGIYEEVFDGSGLTSGIYLYKLEAKSIEGKPNFVDSKKMIFIK